MESTQEKAVSAAKREIVVPNTAMMGEVVRMLSTGCEVTLTARGDSMLPTIKGDKESVKIRQADRYNVGDVVLAQIAEGVYVMHRIIKLADGIATLRGDGNIRQTESCSENMIAGRVVLKVGKDGKERRIGSAWLWLALPQLARRALLSLYKRTRKRKKTADHS